jgi:hypothetical protein
LATAAARTSDGRRAQKERKEIAARYTQSALGRNNTIGESTPQINIVCRQLRLHHPPRATHPLFSLSASSKQTYKTTTTAIATFFLSQLVQIVRNAWRQSTDTRLQVAKIVDRKTKNECN